MIWLPLDVWGIILKNIDLSDKFAFRLVCKGWRDLLKNIPHRHTREVQLQTANYLHKICKFEEISINLGNNSLPSWTTSLKRMHIRAYAPIIHSWEKLENLKCITESFSFVGVFSNLTKLIYDGEFIQNLDEYCPNLRVLKCDELELPINLPSLEKLYIDDYDGLILNKKRLTSSFEKSNFKRLLDDNGGDFIALSCLGELNSLTKLSFSWHYEFKDILILSNLRELKTEELTENIKFPNLTHLNILYNFSVPYITITNFPKLCNLTGIIDRSEITKQIIILTRKYFFITEFKDFPNLKRLDSNIFYNEYSPHEEIIMHPLEILNGEMASEWLSKFPFLNTKLSHITFKPLDDLNFM